MNDNQSPIPNVSGGYETLQIIIIVVIGVLIAFFIFSTYAIEYVNNNWNEYRCQPLYMMIAGILGHDPDENNKYCIEKQATNSCNFINNLLLLSSCFSKLYPLHFIFLFVSILYYYLQHIMYNLKSIVWFRILYS